MARTRAQRMTSVPITSIKSGAGILDLIPLPLPVYIVVRLLIGVFKHWYIWAIVFLTVLTAFDLVEWFHVLILALLVPLTFFGNFYRVNSRWGLRANLQGTARALKTKRNWPRIIATAKLDDGPRPPKLYFLRRTPVVLDDVGSALQITLDLSGVNATLTELDTPERRRKIADAAKADRVRIRPGKRPAQALLILEWANRGIIQKLDQASTTEDIQTKVATLDIDDVPFILDVSTLIVGKVGSGKSNLTWTYFRALQESNIPWRARVIDPKMVELDALRRSSHVDRYYDGLTGTDEFQRGISAFHNDLFATLEQMKVDGLRSAPISEKYPLNVLAIDELLLIPNIASMGADSELGRILSVGRAANYVVFASTQLPQVDTVGRLRDLFAQRVCMATTSAEVTTAALGPRAEERGAKCSEITERGVGYIYTDFHGGFRRFRPPYVSDQEILEIGAK